MSNNKNKKIKCLVEGCIKEVQANGLCSTHYNNYIRSGELAGVYKITLKDKIYVGMSVVGLNTRILTEKSRLIANNPESVSRGLLNYFNELCNAEPHLSRKGIADKYFSFEIIESSTRWSKVDENLNTIEFKDRGEQADLTFRANISTNPEIQYWNKLLEIRMRSRESQWIKYYKDLDDMNGTHNCLNIRC